MGCPKGPPLLPWQLVLVRLAPVLLPLLLALPQPLLLLLLFLLLPLLLLLLLLLPLLPPPRPPRLLPLLPPRAPRLLLHQRLLLLERAAGGGAEERHELCVCVCVYVLVCVLAQRLLLLERAACGGAEERHELCVCVHVCVCVCLHSGCCCWSVRRAAAQKSATNCVRVRGVCVCVHACLRMWMCAWSGSLVGQGEAGEGGALLPCNRREGTKRMAVCAPCSHASPAPASHLGDGQDHRGVVCGQVGHAFIGEVAGLQEVVLLRPGPGLQLLQGRGGEVGWSMRCVCVYVCVCVSACVHACAFLCVMRVHKTAFALP